MEPLYAAGSVFVPCDVPASSGPDALLVPGAIAVGPWLLVVAIDAAGWTAVGAAGDRPVSEHADTTRAAVKINPPEKT